VVIARMGGPEMAPPAPAEAPGAADSEAPLDGP